MIIVSDTSPISNLLQIEHLFLIPSLFGGIVIPPKVNREILALAQFGINLEVFQKADWIKIKAPSNTQLVQQLLNKLDEGEDEAIALSIELDAAFILMDDCKGWKIASEYAVPAIGVIGILIRAKQKQLIPSVMPLVDQLKNQVGFWINDTFTMKSKTWQENELILNHQNRKNPLCRPCRRATLQHQHEHRQHDRSLTPRIRHPRPSA